MTPGIYLKYTKKKKIDEIRLVKHVTVKAK